LDFLIQFKQTTGALTLPHIVANDKLDVLQRHSIGWPFLAGFGICRWRSIQNTKSYHSAAARQYVEHVENAELAAELSSLELRSVYVRATDCRMTPVMKSMVMASSNATDSGSGAFSSPKPYMMSATGKWFRFQQKLFEVRSSG